VFQGGRVKTKSKRETKMQVDREAAERGSLSLLNKTYKR
jgi:hypothetical protein